MSEIIQRPFHLHAGSKGPALIFVHGFGCSHTDWTPRIDLLSDQLCLAVDLPAMADRLQPAKAPSPRLPEPRTASGKTWVTGT